MLKRSLWLSCNTMIQKNETSRKIPVYWRLESVRYCQQTWLSSFYSHVNPDREILSDSPKVGELQALRCVELCSSAGIFGSLASDSWREVSLEGQSRSQDPSFSASRVSFSALTLSIYRTGLYKLWFLPRLGAGMWGEQCQSLTVPYPPRGRGKQMKPSWLVRNV